MLQRVMCIVRGLPAWEYIIKHNSFNVYTWLWHNSPSSMIARNQIANVVSALWVGGRENSYSAYSGELFLCFCFFAVVVLALLTCYYTAVPAAASPSEICWAQQFLHLQPLLKFLVWLQGEDPTLSLVILSKSRGRHLLSPHSTKGTRLQL